MVSSDMSNYYILDNSNNQIILNGSSGTLTMNVQRESHKQTSDLDIVSYALSGSSQTEAYDYSGVVRMISIEGIVVSSATNSGADLIDNFVIKINDLQNGNQPARQYHSALLDDNRASGTYNDGIILVKIRNFSWEYINAQMTMIKWNIDLVESI